MNLRFQNRKEQTYLIHEDAEGQGLGAKPHMEKLGNSQPLDETIMGRLGNL